MYMRRDPVSRANRDNRGANPRPRGSGAVGARPGSLHGVHCTAVKRNCARILALLLGASAGAAGDEPAREDPEAKRTDVRIEATELGLEATFGLPEGWTDYIDTDGGASGYKDPRIRDEILKTKRLPNADFGIDRGWCNHGEVLAQMRLRLGRKEFHGTLRELADRCVREIRDKWPAFKSTKPAEKALALRTAQALYVTLENRKEPPYRVHFAVLLADGKGCGLFCYGWGPQVSVADLSGGQMPDSVRKIAENARRLSAGQLKKQAALFREFETAIVPTLRVVPSPPAPEAPPQPPAR